MTGRRYAPLAPHRPPADPCPRLQVLDHTLVQPAAVPGQAQVARELDDAAHALYRLCADQPRPMAAMEIAARLSQPRGATALMIAHLAQQGLVRLSPPRPAAVVECLEEVLRGLHR